MHPAAEELLSEETVTRAVTAVRDMKSTPKPDRRLAELQRLVAEGILSQEAAAPAMERLRPAERWSRRFVNHWRLQTLPQPVPCCDT